MIAQTVRQPDPEIEDAVLVDTPSTAPTAAPLELEPRPVQPLTVVPESGAVSGEVITREAQLQILERTATDLRNSMLNSRLRYGQVLREYYQLCKEEGRRFQDFCDRQGLTIAAAYRAIQIANCVDQRPALAKVTDDNYSKIHLIIQELDERELDKLASGESDLVSLDDIPNMTVRQLREKLRAAQTNVQKQIDRHTKVLRQEVEDVTKDRDRLAAIADDSLAGVRKTVTRLEEQLLDITRTITGLYGQLDALPRDEVIHPAGQTLLEQINGQVRRVARAGDMLWEHWYERSYNDWGYEERAAHPASEA